MREHVPTGLFAAVSARFDGFSGASAAAEEEEEAALDFSPAASSLLKTLTFTTQKHEAHVAPGPWS